MFLEVLEMIRKSLWFLCAVFSLNVYMSSHLLTFMIDGFLSTNLTSNLTGVLFDADLVPQGSLGYGILLQC
jgi:hypothetical protein